MNGPSHGDVAPPGTRGGWIPLLVAGAFLMGLAWRLDFLCDDAYISFRYARNLADGHGFRFNPGDAPVEGFTNLLWVLYLAPFEALGLPIEIVARATSVPCALILLFLLGRELARSRGATPLDIGFGLLLAACCPTLGAWATGGLSTLPFALCVFGMFRALARGSERVGPLRPTAYPWIAAVVLLRADGFVWVIGVYLARAWAIASGRGVAGPLGPRAQLRAEVPRLGGVVVLLVLSLIAFRWWTFGDWIPNTARAKGQLSLETFLRGGQYVASFFLEYPVLALFGCLGARAALRPGAEVSTRSALVLLATTLAYAVAVGGDFMAWFRFLVPAVPFLALLGAAWVRSVPWARSTSVAAPPSASPGLRPLGGLGAGGLGAVLLFLPTLSLAPVVLERPVVHASVREAVHFRWSRPGEPHSEFAKWRLQKERAESNAMLGKALALVAEPGESMVRQGIGAVGYFAGMTILDPHGLTDRGALEHGVRRSHKNAGHEILAPASYFDPREPTYFGADLVSLEEAQSVPERWKRGAGRRSRFEVEIHPLDPGLGFPADCALRLVRYRSWP